MSGRQSLQPSREILQNYFTKQSRLINPEPVFNLHLMRAYSGVFFDHETVWFEQKPDFLTNCKAADTHTLCFVHVLCSMHMSQAKSFSNTSLFPHTGNHMHAPEPRRAVISSALMRRGIRASVRLSDSLRAHKPCNYSSACNYGHTAGK